MKSLDIVLKSHFSVAFTSVHLTFSIQMTSSVFVQKMGPVLVYPDSPVILHSGRGHSMPSNRAVRYAVLNLVNNLIERPLSALWIWLC